MQGLEPILTTNAQTHKLNQKISRRPCKFPVDFQEEKNNSSRFAGFLGVLDTLVSLTDMH